MTSEIHNHAFLHTLRGLEKNKMKMKDTMESAIEHQTRIRTIQKSKTKRRLRLPRLPVGNEVLKFADTLPPLHSFVSHELVWFSHPSTAP